MSHKVRYKSFYRKQARLKKILEFITVTEHAYRYSIVTKGNDKHADHNSDRKVGALCYINIPQAMPPVPCERAIYSVIPGKIFPIPN
jgi:hypothetical protein